mmetsp:Transcript_15959/g.24103  ORF Transcript_15959/g.24103 Transcript_15959/m.24103 type:complete len:176 (-) Transcript_15959:156-683(-)
MACDVRCRQTPYIRKDEEKRMKQYESLEQKLEVLKKDFPSFMKNLKGTVNDFTRGKIDSIQEVSPSPSLVRGFCGGRDKQHMALGIMFHGTLKESVQSIVEDGIYDYSHFTSSFHYAVMRCQHHLHYSNELSHVLAFAVLVDDEERLNDKDVTTRSPCREYVLPLFLITVNPSHH